MSKFYITDEPGSPDELNEYLGLRPGTAVRYVGPNDRNLWRGSGAPHAMALMGPLVVTELIRFPYYPNDLREPEVMAILNDGEYEVNADNLAKLP